MKNIVNDKEYNEIKNALKQTSKKDYWKISDKYPDYNSPDSKDNKDAIDHIANNALKDIISINPDFDEKKVLDVIKPIINDSIT